MIEINFEKFSEFYSSKIEPLLSDFEKERIEICKKYQETSIIVYLAIPVIILLYGLTFLIPKGFLSENIALFIAVFIPIIGFLLCYLFAGILKIKANEQRENNILRLKNVVYTKLFNYLELNYNSYASSEFNNYKGAVLKHIPENKEKYYNFMNFEDEISGKFKGINFELCDATIIKRYVNLHYKNGGPVEEWLFQGLMLAVKLNKPFNTETIIKTDSFKDFKAEKTLIKLEDEEFNKNFKVYADDEVEARYLLTTSFMERLKNFHKNNNDKTIIFFDNKCSESKNMFILTNTGKDNFEIPFNKSILNEKYYYNLLKELVDMLEIAVALKLEQNIGL